MVGEGASELGLVEDPLGGCLEGAEGGEVEEEEVVEEEVVEDQEAKEDGSHHLEQENHQGVLEQFTPVHLILGLGMIFKRKEEKLIMGQNLVITKYQHLRKCLDWVLELDFLVVLDTALVHL